MGILPGCSCVSTTVLMHHLDIIKMLGEKARWELHINVTCYFEQILEKTPYKTAAVWLPTFHLTNHSKHYWRSKDKLINNIFLLTPAYVYANVD